MNGTASAPQSPPAFWRDTGRGLVWLAYGLCCVWLALALSWWLYARLDYSYPLWYSLMDIDQHIAEYAPHNARKPGFAQLPPDQHQQAFAQISQAVHDQGRGLSGITYPGPSGMPIPLLTRDEVLHLQDVADLLGLGTAVSWFMALLWLPLAVWSARAGPPTHRARVAAAGVAAGPLLVWLLVQGPKAVFYQLHIWLFPPEHPWFFYWEQSLMSTLMKAPYLFGGIAVVLAVAAVVLAPVLFLLGNTLIRPLAGARP